MLLRIRWFIVGAIASLGVTGYLVVQLRKAKETLTARNLARSGLRSVADILETASDALRPDGEQT